MKAEGERKSHHSANHLEASSKVEQVSHLTSTQLEVKTYPYPGKSTRYQLSLIRKWFMHCVFPARKQTNAYVQIQNSDGTITIISQLA